MVLLMLNLGIISHERTKSRFVADYSLVTTQHPYRKLLVNKA